MLISLAHNHATFIKNSKLKSCVPWEDATFPFIAAELNQELLTFFALCYKARAIQIGFETISEELACEKKGLDTLSQSEALKVSRLLFVTADASERLKHNSESLVKTHGLRMMGVLLSGSSELLGARIHPKKRPIKVVMIKRKEFVVRAIELLCGVSLNEPN